MNKFYSILDAANYCGCGLLLSECPQDLVTRKLKQPLVIVDTVNECFGVSKRRKGYYTVQEFIYRCSTKVHSKTYGELPICFYGGANAGDDSKLLGRRSTERDLQYSHNSYIKSKLSNVSE